MTRVSKEAIDALCRGLVDRGLLIEAGWKSYQLGVMEINAPAIQFDECRMAFFAGAQHLFGSIMGILDPGPDTEPTADDLRRMSAINDELQRYVETIKARIRD